MFAGFMFSFSLEIRHHFTKDSLVNIYGKSPEIFTETFRLTIFNNCFAVVVVVVYSCFRFYCPKSENDILLCDTHSSG